MDPFVVPEYIDGVHVFHVEDPKLEAYKAMAVIANVLGRCYRLTCDAGAYLVEGDGLVPQRFEAL